MDEVADHRVADALHGRHVKLAALRQWRRRMALSRYGKRQLALAQRHFEHWAQGRALRTWWRRLSEWRIIRRVVSRWRNAIMHRVLVAWAKYTHDQHRLRAAQRRAVAFWKNQLYVFGTRVCVCVLARQVLTDHFLLNMHTHSIARVFNTWREGVWWVHAEREADEHYRATLLSRLLRGWLNHRQDQVCVCVCVEACHAG